MKFKKVLIFSSVIPFLVSCGNSNVNCFDFHYPQSISDDYTAKAYYTDDYFKKDSTVYDPSLSSASLALAMASFSCNKNSTYEHKYSNVEDYFNMNGFVDIYANSYFKEKPSTDSLGVCIAKKVIDGKTLVAIGIRGGGYEGEWASNFTVSDGKERVEHEGFYEAASIYLDSLKDYLQTYKVNGSIKLWSVGYSRGGATNNLAVARIDRRIAENKTIFDDVNVTIKKEDLYAYCFEPPQGASFDEEISPRSDIYSNIHNIVNSNDPVPKVAMSYFRFTRYGVDYYLPDKIRNSDTSDFDSKMLDNYNHMDNRNNLGDYLISDFNMRGSKEEVLDISSSSYVRKNWSSGLFLDELIDNLTIYGVVSRDNYANTLQAGLRTICEILYKNGQTKFSLMNLGIAMAKCLLNDSTIDIVVNNLLHDIKAFETDILYALKTAFESMDVVDDPSEIIVALKTLVVALAKTLSLHIDYFFACLSIDNIKSLAQGHFPEVCLSSLMALDQNYNGKAKTYHNDGSYYYLQVPEVDSSSKIIIKNKSGKEVAGLENGSLLADGKLSYASMKKNFVCYIPADEEYSIAIENATSYDLSYFDQKYPDLVSYKNSLIDSKERIEIKTVAYPEKANAK